MDTDHPGSTPRLSYRSILLAPILPQYHPFPSLTPCPPQVLLRSLVYPGYVHFNCIGSSMFGAIYVGSGSRNADLPFML